MKKPIKINEVLLFGTLAITSKSLAQTMSYGQGPNPYSPPAHMSLREQAATKPLGLIFDVGTGVGRYQDIQAPLASNGDGVGRVDGSKTLIDSSNHTAPILSGRLGWSSDSEYGRQFIALSGMRMSAMPSTDRNAVGSSYVRMALDGGADWNLGDGLSVLSAVELRRSMYRNTDSGHYIDAILLRTGLNQRYGNFMLGANAGVAPMTQFGYTQHNGTSGGLQATSSSLYEWGTTVSWSPLRDATLFIGLSQENVTADMSNVKAYRNLGLNVAGDDDSSEPDRHYRLSTTALTFGATRRF